ncbi:MAG TPA: metal-dependent phosphohydrolase, partial [Streptomyces sp.]|nr:metal-dependent phosphohydrolase [Streptomyces sp.]
MRVRSTPGAARLYILGASVCAAFCALPALTPGAGTPWGTLALLAALCLVCELPAR